MSKNLNFAWFGSWYKNKLAYHFKAKLGIQLTHGDTWSDPAMPQVHPGAKATRSLPLLAVEALEACVMGYIQNVGVSNHMVGFEVDWSAYQHSNSTPSNPPSAPVIAGIEPANLTVWTSLQSTGSGNPQGVGKTELSSFVAMLLMAINDYRLDGHPGSKLIVERYCELVEVLAAHGELPLRGNSTAAQAMRTSPTGAYLAVISTITEKARMAADALYFYAAWTRPTQYGQATGPKASKWICEHRALANNPLFKAGSPDMAALLTDAQVLRAFLNDRVWPRPVAPTPQPQAAPPQPAAATPAAPRTRRPRRPRPTAAPATSPAQPGAAAVTNIASFDEVVTSLALTVVEDTGGCANFLITGPPGSGKTTGLINASDSMPTTCTELDADMDRRDLIAAIERNPDGTWGPVLHDFARACKLAMLRSLNIQLARGISIPQTLKRFAGSGNRTAEILEALVKDPLDKNVQSDLDNAAQPVFGDSWQPIDLAYWEASAPGVGPVYRFIFDEVFDGARSSKLNTFLKAVLAKQRLFSLGIAGSVPLTALNLHLCAAGNASASDRFQMAVISRFHGTYALPKPNDATLISRSKWMVERASDLASNNGKAMKAPQDFSLAAHTYEPPVRKVETLTNACYNELVAFSNYTCTQYESGSLVHPLDARGVISASSMMAHMKGRGLAEGPAFSASLKAVVSKLVNIDPQWGLPVESEMTALLQKVEGHARKL